MVLFEISAFLSPFGLPCKQPAWSYIGRCRFKYASSGLETSWAEIRDSMPGIPLPHLKWVFQCLAVHSTAGNVMFVGGTQDDYIRAINVTNGDELWKGRLPADWTSNPNDL